MATLGLFWELDLHAGEFQLDCIFTSSTKLATSDLISPRFEIKKVSEEFLVFFEEQNREASYINLKFKIKSPLTVVHSSASMITFVEKVPGADNHFSMSIFWKADKNGEFPVVRNSHSWSPAISFYSPEMVLGTCRR